MNPDFSVREYLRHATNQQHAVLDRAASQMHLQSKAGYANFLATQVSALLPLEQALEAGGIAKLLPDWPSRRRADALKADLAELHVTITTDDAPSFLSDAALLGASYVLEGSRLGARMILRQIGQQSATRFLRHGDGSRLWRSFLDVLETNRAIRDDLASAADAARCVFSFFIDAMVPAELVAAE